MTGDGSRGKRVRAVLFAAIMVVSMVAMGASVFAGSAGAKTTNITADTGDDLSVGQAETTQVLSFGTTINGEDNTETYTLDVKDAEDNGINISVTGNGSDVTLSGNANNVSVDSVTDNTSSSDEIEIVVSDDSGNTNEKTFDITVTLTADTTGVSTDATDGIYTLKSDGPSDKLNISLTAPDSITVTESNGNSIDYAVSNVATDGTGTVTIEGGDYSLSQTLTVSDPMTIEAAESANPTISYSASDATDAIVINSPGVTLDGLTVERTNADDTSPAQAVSVRSADGGDTVEVINSVVSGESSANAEDDQNFGIYVAESNGNVDDVELRNNTVSNFSSGVLVTAGDGNTLENVTVDGNTLEDNAYGVAVSQFASATGPQHVTIQNNQIENNDQAGVRVPGSGDTLFTFSKNDLDLSTITVTDNDIEQNGGYGLNASGTNTLNATSNYWGSENGPREGANTYNDGEQGANVSDKATFTPWLNASIDNSNSVEFAPVENDSGGQFANIQAAITSAGSDDTITLASGSFEESVDVSGSDLTIESDDPANPATVTYEGQSDSDGTPTVNINANDVIVQDLVVERVANSNRQDNASYAQGIAIRADNVTVRRNVVEGNLTGVANSHNNRFDGILALNDNGGIQDAIVDDNEVRGFEAGIVVSAYYNGDANTGASVTNNTVEDNQFGVVVKEHSSNKDTVSGVVIERNEVRDSTQDGVLLPGSGTDFQGGTYVDINATSSIDSFQDNDIVNNSVINDGEGTLNATSNWWGSENGPQDSTNTYNDGNQGSGVSDNVEFTPWLDNSTDNGGMEFAPVTNGSGDGFPSIQAAIDASNDETIDVAGGTFEESITVGTRVEISGAGENETTIISDSSKTVTLESQDVTVSDLNITNNGGGNGIDVPSEQNASGLRLADVTISNTSIGFYNDVDSSTKPDFNDVRFSNVRVENSEQKGIYTEGLSDAVLDGVVVDGIESDSYGYNTGIDINLKYDDYQNITIENSLVANVSEGAPSDPSFATGIAVKARDDGNYSNTSATLDDVTIDNVTVEDSFNGLRFGEPGVDYSGSPAGPTGVTVSDSTFEDNEGYHVEDLSGSVDLATVESGNDFDRTATSSVGIYSSIQSAIDTASAGETIEVSSDTYNESVTVDQADINIEPAVTPGEPTINASGLGPAVDIQAQNVTVFGFTLETDSGNGVTVGNVDADAGDGVIIAQNNIVDVSGDGVNADSVSAGLVDATDNYWGSENGPNAENGSNVSANVASDPFLTTQVENLQDTDDDTPREFASELRLDSGLNTLAFPAPSERTLNETVDTDNVETIYVYDNSEQMWLTPGDGTGATFNTSMEPGALDVFVIVVEDGQQAATVMEFENDFDGQPNLDETDATVSTESWNLIGAANASDSSGTAFQGADVLATTEDPYKGPNRQPFEAGSSSYSPYRGYWVYAQGESGGTDEVVSKTYDGLTLQEYLESVNLDN